MTGPYRLNRSLIRVSGPDARGFLQNLLTQDLDGLDTAGVLYAALLSPQGKIVADMNVWADADGVVLEADTSKGPDLLRRLSMYKLRANVVLADVNDAAQVIWSDAPFADARPDPRFANGELGWRKLAPIADDAPNGDEVFEAQRLGIGVPDLARDAGPDEVFALEALLEELNGVAFQKGCFVGQENVSRMKRRATTRKKFCPVVFDGPALPFGAPIRVGEAELGTVRSGAAGRAIALVRLDRAHTATAPLTADGRDIRLDPPPWLILPRREAD
ncbi:MAG: folate-binding protein YgfZ [Hyphomonadaceae bacterium]